MNRCASIFLLLLLMAGPSVAAVGDVSPDGLWTQVDPGRTGLTPSIQMAKPLSVPTFQLDSRTLEAVLADVPHEDDVDVSSGRILSLPMPDGTFARFSMVESPILRPELQAEHPEITTFLGQGIDDPTATLRADRTLFGFRCAILSADGRVYIDPVELGDTGFYISYTKADVAPGEFVCGVTDLDEVGLDLDIAAIPNNGGTRREYALGVQLTGEYTVFFGGSANAFSQSTTTWNRVNQIYERDFAVRLSIYGQQAWLDPLTDPYTTGSTVNSTLLNQAQAQNDLVWGAANYDVGHILTQGGGGGLAQLSVVCGVSKSRGGTGLANPVGDPFDIDYVAHEMGHQFGGSHTFNGTTSSCGGGNRSAANAYEPGSGTTIMAYAGICGAENVQSNSDALFHVRSLEQIITFIGTTACQTSVVTGNTPPVANAGADFSIPRGTPYRLFGSASDANGDALTYVWEQYDLGAASPPTDPLGPLVRSLLPGSSSTRIVPNMTSLLAGSYPWEILPTVDRSMHFRLTVRDNRAASGGVDDDETVITVTGAPFFVNSPNGGEVVQVNQMVTVNWTPGGGAALSANVNILVSENGGSSWSYLAVGTPNDGSHVVQMLCSAGTTQGRIMVESSNQRFFDVSNGNFTISDTRPDYVNGPWPGWDDALVPRPTNDAVFTSVLFPASLGGDATSYLNHAYLNIGNGTDPNSPGVRQWYRIYFDGVLHAQYLDDSRPVGGGGFITNSPRAVSGGRHVFEAIVDEENDHCETNETNNAYARQFVWSPTDLTVESMVSRAAPPRGDAGWSSLSASGYPIEFNADGVGFRQDTFQTFWNAAGLHAVSVAENYDLALMNPHPDIFTGFDNAMWTGVQSLLGPGLTDIVVVNRNTVGGDHELWIGNQFGDGSGDYLIEHRGAPLAVYTVPAQETVPVSQDQMLFMRELWVGATQDLTISVDVAGAAQPVQLAFFDASFQIGTQYDAVALVTTDGAGHGEFTLNVPGGAYYGILVYRDSVLGSAPIDVTVKVRGPVNVQMDTAALGPVSLFSVPDGSGNSFLQAWSWDGVPGSTPVPVDATIEVTVSDIVGTPIAGFPLEDVRLVSSGGGLKACPPGNLADSDTDAGGSTQFQNALEAGGHSGGVSTVLYDCPDDPGGDGIGRGFYAPSWPGATLDEVLLYFTGSVAGTYDIRLTVRETAYDGPILGVSTVSASVTTSTPVVFPFSTPQIAAGTTVTFAITQISGPGGLFYDVPNAGDPGCGIIETNGTTPPLDTFRRDGVRTRIVGTTPLELAQVEIVGVPSFSATYGSGGPGLDIRFNSPDISGDRIVNLTDLGVFAVDFGGSAYRSDFRWDGVVNLSDLGVFALGFGSACAAPREPLAMNMPQGIMSVAYDPVGKQRDRAVDPGDPFEAYLLVEGEAARLGVQAWEGAFQTSENLRLVDVVLAERNLNVGSGAEYIVGLGETRIASDDKPLVLATLKLLVTDAEPAYLYLRPTALQSAGYAPAVVLGDGTLAPVDISSVAHDAVLAVNDGSAPAPPSAFVYTGPNLRNEPNPFNPSTQIHFDLPHEGRAAVAIFDVAGRLVTRLDAGRVAAGSNSVQWNGKDHRGVGVTSGVYYYRLFLDGQYLGATGRMSLLK